MAEKKRKQKVSEEKMRAEMEQLELDLARKKQEIFAYEEENREKIQIYKMLAEDFLIQEQIALPKEIEIPTKYALWKYRKIWVKMIDLRFSAKQRGQYACRLYQMCCKNLNWIEKMREAAMRRQEQKAEEKRKEIEERWRQAGAQISSSRQFHVSPKKENLADCGGMHSENPTDR